MRRNLTLTAIFSAAILLASPAFAVDKASAVLKDASGKEVGRDRKSTRLNSSH